MKKLLRYKSIGKEELIAAKKVIKSGVLSDFVGAKGKNFEGGKEVRNFENSISKYFKVKYAISVNSWTSGLICSIGAINPEPGQEIICTPWTMCATATATGRTHTSQSARLLRLARARPQLSVVRRAQLV